MVEMMNTLNYTLTGMKKDENNSCKAQVTLVVVVVVKGT
jgi:hypothetical protein